MIWGRNERKPTQKGKTNITIIKANEAGRLDTSRFDTNFAAKLYITFDIKKCCQRVYKTKQA